MTEIIMLCGVPGSGKTHTVKTELVDADVYLSRDALGGHVHDLVPMMEEEIAQGAKKIVLDCTFVTKEHRDPFVAAARRLGVPIHCWFFKTSKEVSQFNLCWRMVQRYGKVLRTDEDYKECKNDPNMFPPMVMFTMFKKLVEPDISEGFDSIRTIKPQPWAFPEEFKNSAVILDYDGTVRATKSGDKYPRDPSDIEVFPQATKKLRALASDGVLLLGASNQSGVAKNDPPMDVCKACFAETNHQLGVHIDVDFDYSPPGPVSSWHRKPFPGLGVDAIWKNKLNPSKCVYVGDQTVDRTFAKRCGFQFEWAKDFFGL